MKKRILLLLVGMSLSTASMMAFNIGAGGSNLDCNFVYQGIGYQIIDSAKHIVEVTYIWEPGIMTSPQKTMAQPLLMQNSSSQSESDVKREVVIPEYVENDGTRYHVEGITEYGFTLPSYDSIGVVTFPASIKRVGSNTFDCNVKIDKVIFTGKNPTEMGNYIIDRSGVNELELSDGVEELRGDVFGFNRSTKRIKLGAGLHRINAACFKHLVALETLDLSPDNPYLSLHHGVLFNHDKTRLMAAPAGLKGSFEIPEGTVEVDSSACSSCSLSYFKYPSTLRKIGYMAFSFSSVKKAELPEGLEYIGKRAFDYAGSLEELTIPSTVRFIGEGAFKECTSLKAVHCRRAEPLDIADNTFWKVDLNNCVLYVPKGSADAYRNAPVWQQFRRIKEETAGIDDIAADAVQSVKYVNLAGMESDKPFAGLNIVVTTLADGSRRTAKQRF